MLTRLVEHRQLDTAISACVDEQADLGLYLYRESECNAHEQSGPSSSFHLPHSETHLEILLALAVLPYPVRYLDHELVERVDAEYRALVIHSCGSMSAPPALMAATPCALTISKGVKERGENMEKGNEKADSAKQKVTLDVLSQKGRRDQLYAHFVRRVQESRTPPSRLLHIHSDDDDDRPSWLSTTAWTMTSSSLTPS